MSGNICLLAHNIRSLWNIGSLFRTADAMGVEKIWLTGYTATPPRREISKTAIGADEWIAWEYERDALEVVRSLKQNGWKVVGLEITKTSTPLREYKPDGNTCLVIGHEITGVPDEILKECDDVVHIPMNGKKESLNVAVAAGIALHHLRELL